MYIKNIIILVMILFNTILFSKDLETEKNWGVAAVIRTATIPFNTQDNTVSSFVPLIFYEDDIFYIDGLEGGVKLYDSDKWRISILSRIRFFDIPKEYQNEIQGDTFDFGIQTRYKLSEEQNINFELMQDTHGYNHANLNYSLVYEKNSWELNPYTNIRYKDSDFNKRYYGLDQENIGSGVDFAAGIKVKYHVTSNLYLLASAQRRWLDSNAKNSSFIDTNTQDEFEIGLGFFNDKTKAKRKIKLAPYIRIAHGWATPSDIGDILTGNSEKDKYNNQISSIFYGHPLTDEIFSLPLDIYLTPGFIWHYSSEVQKETQEYVLAIKAYYTIPLPIKLRLGVAEGLSYIKDITYVERSELESKGYKPNNLMNYIDLSLDLHLGDIFGRNLNNMWLGYSIHHRSAIFESASHFGRIKGGSNYNSIYLQCHF